MCQNIETNLTDLDPLTKVASYTQVIHPCWRQPGPPPTDPNLILFNFGCHQKFL